MIRTQIVADLMGNLVPKHSNESENGNDQKHVCRVSQAYQLRLSNGVASVGDVVHAVSLIAASDTDPCAANNASVTITPTRWPREAKSVIGSDNSKVRHTEKVLLYLLEACSAEKMSYIALDSTPVRLPIIPEKLQAVALHRKRKEYIRSW